MQLVNTLIIITAPGIYFDFPCILLRKQYSILTSKTSHSRVFPSSFPKNIYHAVGGCYSTGFFLFSFHIKVQKTMKINVKIQLIVDYNDIQNEKAYDNILCLG